MVNQFVPEFLGVAHPFTMNLPCSGADLDRVPVWRRRTWRKCSGDAEHTKIPNWPKLKVYPSESVADMLEWPISKRLGIITNQQPMQAHASELNVAAFNAMVARRCEGQFRRHWAFMPSSWNLRLRFYL